MTDCTYCGDYGNTLDHVTPVSFEQTTRKNASFDKSKVVPCCSECNNLLGPKLFRTIGTRAMYLVGKYEKRYAKLLSAPSWNSDELDELGYALRETIKASLKEKAIVEAKIEKLKLTAELDPTIEEVWEIYNDKLGEIK